jgi:hypothetical protein
MLTQEFRLNRSRFPREELEKHRGQWVAFSSDGRRIVASAPTLEGLERQFQMAGEDAQQLAFEGTPGPNDEIFLGAEELH